MSSSKAYPVPSPGRPVSGVAWAPGSKSITNRALLIAGLAEGESVIEGALFSDDTAYLSAALRALGVPVTEGPDNYRFTVSGRGGVFPAHEADLFVGNAGTATRFLVAAVALGQGRFRVDGTPRMRERPIGPLVDGLRQLGAQVSYQGNEGFPPLIIDGHGLAGGSVAMRGDLSSQYFSALMMAGPLTKLGMTLHITGTLVSRPFVDLTAGVMSAFGGEATLPDPATIVIPGNRPYRGRRYLVEPDATAASYWFAAAAVTGGAVTVRGLGTASAQGDLRFVDILERMGCEVRREPEAVTVQGPVQLRGVAADFSEISDTSLTLAAIAPFADGPVVVSGIEHSRQQESDRVHAAATELQRLGVPVEEREDGWVIQPATPRAGEIATYDDHRMAMSFAILGLRTPGTVILDPGCVSKTFPDFFQRLESLLEG